jgi:hypothetical protein
MKLLTAVILLIAAILVAGTYFDFNPVIPIFLILGFGVYRVSRWDAPSLPEGSRIYFGGTSGVYLRRQDYMTPDAKDHSGGHLRDGVDPNEPGNMR